MLGVIHVLLDSLGMVYCVAHRPSRPAWVDLRVLTSIVSVARLLVIPLVIVPLSRFPNSSAYR